MTESLCMYVIGVEDDGPCVGVLTGPAPCGAYRDEHDLIAGHPYQPPVRRCGHPESEHVEVPSSEFDNARWVSVCRVCNNDGQWHPFTVEAEEEARA